jgi:small subunit ribosomal protein S18
MGERSGRRDSSDRRSRSRDRDSEDTLGPRKRSRFLEGVKSIDPDDYELIRKFLTEHGKIMPARITGLPAKQQRQVKNIIRRLRVMGIVP